MAGTRWQVHDLPEADVLAALGRVATRHGFLNHVLIRTIKTLDGLTVEDADRRFARCGNARLREAVEARVVQRLGKDVPATRTLLEMLDEAKRVTEVRNAVVHGLWARDVDSEEAMIIDVGSSSAPPTPAQLDQLAAEILQIATAINHGRLSGFLHEALRVQNRDGSRQL
jgi:hypothetical protein